MILYTIPKIHNIKIDHAAVAEEVAKAHSEEHLAPSDIISPVDLTEIAIQRRIQAIREKATAGQKRRNGGDEDSSGDGEEKVTTPKKQRKPRKPKKEKVEEDVDS
ncbi:MAG: hypothetical protein MMC33_003824 [Icmadophila ericetorum]|nr:hypothetical protein [Icmadophila ericetorum]